MHFKTIFSFCCGLDLLAELLYIFFQLFCHILYLFFYLLSLGFDKNTPWYYPLNLCYGSFLIFGFIVFVFLVIADKAKKEKKKYEAKAETEAKNKKRVETVIKAIREELTTKAKSEAEAKANSERKKEEAKHKAETKKNKAEAKKKKEAEIKVQAEAKRKDASYLAWTEAGPENNAQTFNKSNLKGYPFSSTEPIRITHCFRCKNTLKSTVDHKCSECKWLKCKCGACRCNYGQCKI